MLSASSILVLHDHSTQLWHRDQPHAVPPGALHPLVLSQHRANYDLWHQEDEARSPNASEHIITSVKHNIDRLNQLRNDLAEQIDTLLLDDAGPQNQSAPLHSESPGLIIDRLSILALKVYHTALEVHRPSASEAHHVRNQQRLQLLTMQRADLAACLDTLWSEVLAGTRRFKLYRQLKMYNDPELNPVLYRKSALPQAGS